jgi:mannose-6-phosphate isomerase-like protein (cupin superfamily)
MGAGRVTTAEAALAAGGATTLRTDVLEQRVARLDAGERITERIEVAEVLFVAAGTGALTLNGHEHALTGETGAFLAEGDEIEIRCEEQLELVRVRVGAPTESSTARVVNTREQDAEPAGIGREFHVLAGCSQATQFVGLVPPGRANMHNHPYDELAFLLEGEGVLHWQDGTSVPVRRGSCIHFPRLVFHSLENVGGATLRIMGVFHPAGSPADRVAVLDY